MEKETHFKGHVEVGDHVGVIGDYVETIRDHVGSIRNHQRPSGPMWGP